jgi:hypothetical protein
MVSAIPRSIYLLITALDILCGRREGGGKSRDDLAPPREKRMMAPGPSRSMSSFFAARELSHADVPSITIPCNPLTRDFKSIRTHMTLGGDRVADKLLIVVGQGQVGPAVGQEQG